MPQASGSAAGTRQTWYACSATLALILFAAAFLTQLGLFPTTYVSSPHAMFETSNSLHASRATLRMKTGVDTHVLGRKPFVTMVVVVTSAAAWADRRARIRHQFPRNAELVPAEQTVLLKFAVGIQNLDHDILLQARKEAANRTDMLFFDCLDMDQELNDINNWHLNAGPSATTQKVLLSIEWAVQHFDFEYFFRLGDDSYFRVDKFMALLAAKEVPSAKAVVGRMQSGYVFDMQQTYPQGCLCCHCTQYTSL